MGLRPAGRARSPEEAPRGVAPRVALRADDAAEVPSRAPRVEAAPRALEDDHRAVAPLEDAHAREFRGVREAPFLAAPACERVAGAELLHPVAPRLEAPQRALFRVRPGCASIARASSALRRTWAKRRTPRNSAFRRARATKERTARRRSAKKAKRARPRALARRTACLSRRRHFRANARQAAWARPRTTASKTRAAARRSAGVRASSGLELRPRAASSTAETWDTVESMDARRAGLVEALRGGSPSERRLFGSTRRRPAASR